MYGLALTFFTDGFERSALTLSYALYELSVNTDVQKKLHEELQQAIKDGKLLNYDTLIRLPYLHKVVSGKTVLYISFFKCAYFIYIYNTGNMNLPMYTPVSYTHLEG